MLEEAPAAQQGMEMLSLRARTGWPLTPGHKLLLVGNHAIPAASSRGPAGSSSPFQCSINLGPSKGGLFSCRAHSGAGSRSCATSMSPAGTASSSFLLPLVQPCICCGTLLQPCMLCGTFLQLCCKGMAVQGHLFFLWANKGSAAGPVSWVCSNKLSSATSLDLII